MKISKSSRALFVLLGAMVFGGCETPPKNSSPAAALPPLSLAQGEGEVLDSANVDQAPVVRSRQMPRYPTEMRRAGVEGRAIVEFIVDKQGNVRNARAVKFNHESFGRAAVDAVSGWKFRPGIKDGVAVNTRMETPLMFTLNEIR